MKTGFGAALCFAQAVVMSLVSVSSPAHAANEEIGAVLQRDYRDALARLETATPRAIRYRDKVFSLDTVSTGATGTTSLQFLDDTRLDVGPGAEVRLDDFVYDPVSTVGAGEMSFAVGAFRYVGGRMTTEENVRLKTPTATMVIRGTELVIFVWSDGRTEVNVISGAVEVSACGGGGSQLAMSGMQVTVTPDCVAKRSAVRSLPPGFAALSLPDRPTDDGGDEDDDDDRRGREGQSSGGKGARGGGESGGNNNGGGGRSRT